MSGQNEIDVSIVLPAFNEEGQLSWSVANVREAASALPVRVFEIVIADNGSTDKTGEIGLALSRSCDDVRYLRIKEPGRGRALKHAWNSSRARVLVYMDVDLSTGLEYLPLLYGAICSGAYDLAFGTRLQSASQTQRSIKREIISRSYNALLKLAFRAHFSDAQCGFKAISRSAAQRLLCMTQSSEWFFDTELLVLAERLGYKLCEIPVRWREDPGTQVRILRTIWEDLVGIVRLRARLN